MRRFGLSLAAIFLLRADMYPDASNAKLPAAQRNLGQIASIVPQQYGAVGDGAADDTAAVQAWFNDLKAGNYLGQCNGIFRLTDSVNAFPAKAYRVEGQMPAAAGGCQFLVDYNGWGSAAIDLSPTNSNRGAAAWIGNVSVTYNAALTAPPVAFRQRYSSGLHLRGVSIFQYTANRGTCLSLSTAWNLRLQDDVQVWGCGGNVPARLVPAGVTFAIPFGGTTLTSSAAFFAAADVGQDIVLQGNTYEAFRITGFTNSTSVTVGRTASATHTADKGALSAVSGGMTAANPVLTVSHANLSAADVGRNVYVLGAGPTLGTAVTALRSTITGVSGTAVTLADAAGTTAPPGSLVIIGPAVEIYTEGSDLTNDVRIDGLHIEQHSGTGLVILKAVNLRGSEWKFHGWNSANFGETANESQLGAVLIQTDLQLGQADIEGTMITTAGQMLLQGITTGGNTVQMLGGFMMAGQPKVAVSKLDAGQAVSIGQINGAAAVVPAWLPSVVSSDGTGSGVIGQGAVTAQGTTAQLPLLIGTLPKALVANLPACAAATEGRMYGVSDANSAVFNAAVAAGGANKVIAYCNGTGWAVH